MEIKAEDFNAENVQDVTISRTISLKERIEDLRVNLEDRLKIGELEELDRSLGETEDWEIVRINLNKGRLFPRAQAREPGVVETGYEYGNKLQKGERGITPTELFSMLTSGYFEGLKGVFIPGIKEGELLLLDMSDLDELSLRRQKLSQIPSFDEAKDYAFPTAMVPLEK